MFINSFMNHPFALDRHTREGGYPGRLARRSQARTPTCAGVTQKEIALDSRRFPSIAALFELDIEA
jgi:hypothetical protein